MGLELTFEIACEKPLILLPIPGDPAKRVNSAGGPGCARSSDLLVVATRFFLDFP